MQSDSLLHTRTHSELLVVGNGNGNVYGLRENAQDGSQFSPGAGVTVQSGIDAMQHTRKRNALAHVLGAAEPRNRTLESEAEAGVRH